MSIRKNFWIRFLKRRFKRIVRMVLTANLEANLKEAVISLNSTKQRSLTALVGIVVGIGSVIAMVSVGGIAKIQALEQFRELGTDFLTIRVNPAQSGSGSHIKLEDALLIPQGTRSIVAASPWIQSYSEAVYGGKKVADVSIMGVTETFTQINKLWIAEGRSISDLDFRREHCVIGAEVASVLTQIGEDSLIGTSIRIRNRLCLIIGVLKEAPRLGGVQMFDADHSIFVPIRAAERMFPARGIRHIAARMKPDVHHLAAAQDVRDYFDRIAPNLNVRVTSAQKVIEQMQRQTQTFALLLAAIGSISLIVGGVGVMNVMLVAVSERRTEIGIRRALGARRIDIQMQFLLEAAVLALIGGVIGILLGIASTWIYCHFTGWLFRISFASVGIGFIVSCCVGVFFGLMPAIQAARLDPIAALRTR